jgi:hypothetical protein
MGCVRVGYACHVIGMGGWVGSVEGERNVLARHEDQR